MKLETLLRGVDGRAEEKLDAVWRLKPVKVK